MKQRKYAIERKETVDVKFGPAGPLLNTEQIETEQKQGSNACAG